MFRIFSSDLYPISLHLIFCPIESFYAAKLLIYGTIRPYALLGHNFDADGLQQIHAIPDRLETFVQTVNNHIALQSKPDSEKRVAIYYYKDPGQNAMTAADMEVVRRSTTCLFA